MRKCDLFSFALKKKKKPITDVKKLLEESKE